MKTALIIFTSVVLSAGTVIGYLEIRRTSHASSTPSVAKVEPTKASRADLVELVSLIDELKKDLKAPYDLAGVDHFKTMAGYAEAGFQRWLKKCPTGEPLRDTLEGAVYELSTMHKSMTFAFTVKHPVNSGEEIAEEVLGKLHKNFSPVREMALASMASAN